ncbi:unnamed protein product [Ilex paraguariensis]|uniref:UspA domain-containing protein n=1 Tax=Ilex paraguariensis TaxID=185542 RepID=A0ABC8TNL7_9AQUA
MEEQQQQVLMPPVKKTIMKVLVAIDESDASFYALKWTLDRLFLRSAVATPTPEPSNLEDSDVLTVVHVIQPFQHYILPAIPPVPVYVDMEASRKVQEENVASILSRALRMCKEKMIKAETLILQGDPKEMICQAVEDMNADLLVVGNRGRSKIKRVLLGSVSDYCAHHAKYPVLIVKPGKESSQK